ncbi:DUF2249 domain-containing protein [Sporosarcina sp. HYO08]|uniref:DUF2249 domain-containing protein n=1 Tax=Sporosarcina sp. HYO08 TaxID=1759557 RepID=UPI000798B556|nr:DUF2249 domain-containing protein [Sporosarcina sp. HYO08]KXH78808.1 universal stress protein [Sporosarcina sp. HYO08]
MDLKTSRVVELDVRPHLKKKIEPFQLIMDAVKALEEEDIFILHATFKPTPLLGVLKMKGFVNKVEKKANDHWIVTFVNKKHKHLLNGEHAENDEKPSKESGALVHRESQTITLDNRGLEPPQPMMRTLAALDRSRPGDEVHIHNDRVPVFLIEELNQMGCSFTVEEQQDGSAKVKIQKT